jgi:3-phosphoshikimate 1-carboxyvinyltransferase
MIIEGLGQAGEQGRLKGTRGRSHGDHRVAMSLAIAALTAGSESLIEDVACIETSFPDFRGSLMQLVTADE